MNRREWLELTVKSLILGVLLATVMLLLSLDYPKIINDFIVQPLRQEQSQKNEKESQAKTEVTLIDKNEEKNRVYTNKHLKLVMLNKNGLDVYTNIYEKEVILLDGEKFGMTSFSSAYSVHFDGFAEVMDVEEWGAAGFNDGEGLKSPVKSM